MLPSLKLTAFSPLSKTILDPFWETPRIFRGENAVGFRDVEAQDVNHKIHRNLRLPNAATFPGALREYEGLNQSLHKGSLFYVFLLRKLGIVGGVPLEFPWPMNFQNTT